MNLKTEVFKLFAALEEELKNPDIVNVNELINKFHDKVEVSITVAYAEKRAEAVPEIVAALRLLVLCYKKLPNCDLILIFDKIVPFVEKVSNTFSIGIQNLVKLYEDILKYYLNNYENPKVWVRILQEIVSSSLDKNQKLILLAHIIANCPSQVTTEIDPIYVDVPCVEITSKAKLFKVDSLISLLSEYFIPNDATICPVIVNLVSNNCAEVLQALLKKKIIKLEHLEKVYNEVNVPFPGKPIELSFNILGHIIQNYSKSEEFVNSYINLFNDAFPKQLMTLEVLFAAINSLHSSTVKLLLGNNLFPKSNNNKSYPSPIIYALKISRFRMLGVIFEAYLEYYNKRPSARTHKDLMQQLDLKNNLLLWISGARKENLLKIFQIFKKELRKYINVEIIKAAVDRKDSEIISGVMELVDLTKIENLMDLVLFFMSNFLQKHPYHLYTGMILLFRKAIPHITLHIKDINKKDLLSYQTYLGKVLNLVAVLKFSLENEKVVISKNDDSNSKDENQKLNNTYKDPMRNIIPNSLQEIATLMTSQFGECYETGNASELDDIFNLILWNKCDAQFDSLLDIVYLGLDLVFDVNARIKIGKNNWNIVILATLIGGPVLKKVLEKNVNFANPLSQGALILAITFRDNKSVAMILQSMSAKKFNSEMIMNLYNASHQTPLSCAVSVNNVIAAKLLLEHHDSDLDARGLKEKSAPVFLSKARELLKPDQNQLKEILDIYENKYKTNDSPQTYNTLKVRLSETSKNPSLIVNNNNEGQILGYKQFIGKDNNRKVVEVTNDTVKKLQKAGLLESFDKAFTCNQENEGMGDGKIVEAKKQLGIEYKIKFWGFHGNKRVLLLNTGRKGPPSAPNTGDDLSDADVYKVMLSWHREK